MEPSRDEFVKTQLDLAHDGQAFQLENDQHGVPTCLSMFLSSRQRIALLTKQPNLRRLEDSLVLDTAQKLDVQNMVAAGIISPDDHFAKLEEQKNARLSRELHESSQISKQLHVQDAGNYETVPVKTGVSFGQAMQNSRSAMRITQKQLAIAMNVKPNVIQDWENGVGVLPTGTQRNNLNRILKTILPK